MSAGFKKANSTEFAPNCQRPVIDVMPEQKALLNEKKYGGTMRLGAYLCEIKPKTLAFKAYFGSKKPSQAKRALCISERHRHRYELNNEFKEALEAKGLVISGINPERGLVEIIELKNHPFFVASQFHPEFKSRPLGPHPLFREFVKAAINAKLYSRSAQVNGFTLTILTILWERLNPIFLLREKLDNTFF